MRRVNWKGWLLILLLLVTAVAIVFTVRIRPLVLEYAQNLMQQTAAYAIQDALVDEIYQNRAQYEDLVTLERDNDSQVTALKTDTILANALKVELERSAYDALNTLEVQEVAVPLGSILAPAYCAGMGPQLHFGVSALGYAQADFISAFTAAGINQTRHRILLEIHAQARILSPFGWVDTEIVSRMAVTDTVIVGTVPEQYTYIDDTEQSLLGKINDYAEPVP